MQRGRGAEEIGGQGRQGGQRGQGRIIDVQGPMPDEPSTMNYEQNTLELIWQETTLFELGKG
jgi:hypothetical protein